MKHPAKAVWMVVLAAAISSGAAEQAAYVEVRRLPLTEAKQVIDTYAGALPENLPPEATHDWNVWARYIEQKETELQSRLEQGDRDTLANLLLFGTSFTKEPVLTPVLLRKIATGAD